MLTELEQVGNGYEIWGQEVVTQSYIPIHFSTPVSYPWEYSQEGAASLVDRLQQLSYVRSAQVEYFPSIHPQLLKQYSDLQPLAKQERVIRVTLKDWPNTHLLSFPTFTVLVFQYLDRNVPYSQIVADWKETIEAFRTLHELRKLLGIEPRLRWQTIPTLTWVHLHYYDTTDFWNRYWSGSDRDVSERNKQFLRENSLVSFGAGDPSNRVKHCCDVSYEYFLPDDSWRFFYATGDWFLGWDDTIYVSSSSPQMTWIRIVRAALLVNVVLPEMAKRSSVLVEGLTRERSRLVNARINAFEMFSLDAIDSLHAEVGRVEAPVRNTSVRQRRIKESVDGYESLLTFLARPFGGPLADLTDSLKPENAEAGWECIEEFFSFRRDNRMPLNDRRKAIDYTRQIRTNLQRLDDSLNSLQHELSNSLSLLEGRRSLLWSLESTILAIIWPAVGAFIAGGLCSYLASRDTEARRNAVTLMITASGACVGGILWYWWRFGF
jgi:hypothetical protein